MAHSSFSSLSGVVYGWLESSGSAFASPGGPLGLDFNLAFAAGRVLAEAAPLPIFRTRYEAAFDWITMHVPQLLDALATCVDLEVIVARLPEGAIARAILAVGAS